MLFQGQKNRHHMFSIWKSLSYIGLKKHKVITSGLRDECRGFKNPNKTVINHFTMILQTKLINAIRG